MPEMKKELQFDAEFRIEDIKDPKGRIYVTAEPFGVTCSGETLNQAIRTAEKGIKHLLDEYEAEGKMFNYLKELGVAYRIVEVPRVPEKITLQYHMLVDEDDKVMTALTDVTPSGVTE